VGEEGFAVGVGRTLERRIAGEKMIGTRRRNGRLRGATGTLVEKREVVGGKACAPLELADHHRHRHAAALLSGIVGENERALDLMAAEAVDAFEESVAPVVAAQLAVGDRLEPDALLHGDRFRDRGVFARAQLLRRQAAFEMRGMRIDQIGGPQQAADVIGPEWRIGWQDVVPAKFWNRTFRGSPLTMKDRLTHHWAFLKSQCQISRLISSI